VDWFALADCVAPGCAGAFCAIAAAANIPAAAIVKAIATVVRNRQLFIESPHF
jgi:hypothetical protein